jgi:hypothetical protein
MRKVFKVKQDIVFKHYADEVCVSVLLVLVPFSFE